MYFSFPIAALCSIRWTDRMSAEFKDRILVKFEFWINNKEIVGLCFCQMHDMYVTYLHD